MLIMNKAKCVVYAVMLLAVGYAGGAYFGMPAVDNDKLAGDVSKARIYNCATGGYADADVEKLCHDTVYQERMVGSVFLLASRVQAADSLVNATVAVTAGIDSLADFNGVMKEMAVKTHNASLAFRELLATMSAVIGGDAGASDGENYEQQLNNAVLAYSVVENIMRDTPLFAETLSANGLLSGNDAVLAVADGWIEYGAEDAVFGGDEEEISLWQAVYSEEKGKGVSNKDADAAFPSLDNVIGKAETLCKTSHTLGKIGSRSLGKIGDRTLGKIGNRTLGKIGGRTLGKIGSRTLGLKQECLGFVF